MSRTIYVNGAYLPEEDAKISVFDRGFLFADGVYEVTAVLGGKLVDYAPHMERLDRSLGGIRMAWPCSRDELRAVHDTLVERNALEEGLVYMQVTRGSADRDFTFPKNTTSNLVAFTQAKTLLKNPLAETGVKVITVPDLRWARRDIKSVMLLPPVLGKQQAAEAGAFEAWMTEDGHITEGTSSSAYIIKNGTIITRPLSKSILAGITRMALFTLAQQKGVAIEERRFTVDEAYAADEAFLTSASSFVLPIVAIDNRPVGTGTPGQIVPDLRRIYLALAQS